MWEELRERLLEIHQSPWSRVGLPGLLGAYASVGLVLLVYLTSREGWVPLLDSLNLVFHEAGHPIFGIFGETIGFLGGTLMQLLVPLMVAAACWQKRQAIGATLSGIWFCQNGFNIARYMADAREQILPLVGGGEHDWATLFGQWGCLEKDLVIARTLRGLAWIGIAVCALWLLHRFAQDRQAR